MRQFLVAVLALAVAGASQSAAFAQAQDDHLIVPGQRIGPVYLGMSAADLYRAMGEPKSSMVTHVDGSGYNDWNDLRVSVSKDGTVLMIDATGPTYALASGVRPGSSFLSIQASRPAPAWSQEIGGAGTETEYCYSDGLDVFEARMSATVYIIGVQSPRC